MEHLPEIIIAALIIGPGITLAIMLYRAHRAHDQFTASPDDFWDHECRTDGTTWAVAKGSPCTWCGETEKT